MKVVITGATGFLGQQTLKTLLQLPNIKLIKAAGRSVKPEHNLEDPRLSYHLGDLTNAAYVDELLDGMTHLVHAAALSSAWGSEAAFKSANLDTTQLLLETAQKKEFKRIVFISTGSLYFNWSDRLNIKESDPLPSKFVNAYAATKRQAELLVENSGLPYIIIRPRAIIGKGDTVIMPRLLRAHAAGKLRIVGSGQNIVDFCSVQNCAQSIVLALLAADKKMNQTFHVSNGEALPLWEVIAEVLTLLEKTPPTKKVPYRLALTFAKMLEFKARLFGQNEPNLTTFGIGVLAKSVTFDISKIKQELGFDPSVTTKQAMLEFVEWYKHTKQF
jgi:nucleoside-diphosphate-sugar epimerase